jgi:thioesterase domain-containing protein
MAQLIASDSTQSQTSKLLTLQALGDKPPLVFMPTLGGTAMFWRDVMEHWGHARPAHALGLTDDNVRWPDTFTLEDIATHYLDGIRHFDPNTPLHLAGYSFGGTLAFEMARQLRNTGHRVGTVVAIDAGPGKLPPHLQHSYSQYIGCFLKNLPRWLEDKMLGNSTEQWQSDLWRKWQSVRRLTGWTPNGGLSVQSAIDTRGLPDSHVQRMQIAYQALQRYVASPYEGDVGVIRAQTSPLFHSFFPDLEWGRVVTGRLSVRWVPGNHNSLLNKRHSKFLASCISDAIKD